MNEHVDAQGTTFIEKAAIPKPIPLPTLPPVPAFDLDLLPAGLQDYVQDVTDRQGCPVDFVAIGALVSLAGAVGRRRCIAAKQEDDWIVIPNLWGMIVGRPSSMKSPALAAATSALREMENDANAAHEKNLKDFQLAEHLHKLSAKGVDNNAAKLAKVDMAGAKATLAAFMDEAPEPPKRKRLIINDASVEKLQELMAENEQGLVLVRDELSGWAQKLESEEYAEARSFFLTAYSGREAFTVDRIGRGTVHIPAACLSIIGGIQPSKVSRMIKGAITGTSDDGLLQRFQLVTWPDDAGAWKWRDRKPHLGAKARFDRIFHDVHGLDYLAEPLRQSNDALALFREWMIDHNRAIRGNGVHPALESHLLKMPEALLSIALLSELSTNPSASQVSEKSMLHALAWADYLRGHIARLYHTASSPELEAARTILGKRNDLENGFTARDVYRKGWTGIGSTAVAAEALEILIDLHYLSAVRTDALGRPTDRYFWIDGEVMS